MPSKGGAIRPSVVAAAPEGPHHREKRYGGAASAPLRRAEPFLTIVEMITRREVAIRLADYLQHRLTLKELVDWAERAMMEEEWEEGHEEVLRDILSRLGLADVEPFAWTWEECEDYLSRWVCRRSGFSRELCVIEGRRFGAVGAASAATLCVIEHRRFGFVGAASVATLLPSRTESSGRKPPLQKPSFRRSGFSRDPLRHREPGSRGCRSNLHRNPCAIEGGKFGAKAPPTKTVFS